MRKDLLVGLNVKITPVNLMFKAYWSAVTLVLYKLISGCVANNTTVCV